MIDVRTAAQAALAAALRHTHRNDDLNRQAAIAILTGFNGGSLLEHAGLRACLHADPEGLSAQWRELCAALDAAELAGSDPAPESARWIGYLSSSAFGALRLAVGLATGRQIDRLGDILCRFDRTNGQVVLDALGIALHVRPEMGER
jgi:hypothetical protein